MSGTTELDFFGMGKENPSKSKLQRLMSYKNMRGGVQGSLSNINPHLLKTVIESGTAKGSVESNGGFFRQNSFKSGEPAVLSSRPFFNPVLRAIVTESSPETPKAPLTIFYNGKVSVFEVPQDKAEIIMKLAEEGKLRTADMVEGGKVTVPSTPSDEKLLENFNGDLPIARKKSLQRFLEKRKERLTMVSPYAYKASDSGAEKLSE